MEQADKPCKCSFSFFSPHRKSRCSFTDKKGADTLKRVGKKKNKPDENKSDDINDDTTTTTNTSEQMCSRSVVSDDNTTPINGEKGANSGVNNDDDDSTLVGIMLNDSITLLGKKIEEPDVNSAEQKELIAMWGNRQCDDCPVAARFPHRKIKCRFKYIVNMVMTELDAARSLVNECTDSSVAHLDESKVSKQCTCFGSRFERHRKEKCLFRAVALTVIVSATTSVAEAHPVDKDLSCLALEMPIDAMSSSGFEQVYNSPNLDEGYDDSMSVISEDEFVEYVTIHNKTYTAEEVRATFERLQNEINRLKMAQREQNEANSPTQPSSLEATPVSPTPA